MLGATSGFAAVVALVALGVLWGMDTGLLEARPAAAGIVVVSGAVLLAAFLTLAPREQVPSRLLAMVALGAVTLLSLAGFLFGPLSLFVVAGVPLTAVVTANRVDRRWGRRVLATGVLASIALAVGGILGWIPLAPAFTDASLRSTAPILVFQAGMLVLGTVLVAMLDIDGGRDERPVVDTVVPAPPRRTARTGSFSLSDLALLDDAVEGGTTTVGDDSLEQQKLESLGVLAGGVAHDFNNLLMSILGNTSLALTDLPSTHPAHAPLREIETASKRARDLVGQLLAFAGKGNVAPAPLDLNALVREMGDLLQTAMKARASLDYDLCSGSTVVMADPTQLRQVVMNLITNAGDAMKERHGLVRLKTRLRRVDAEELAETLLGAACEPGPYVVLTCSDEGCGMEGDTLARIFDPFYTTKRTGRGLGLAAVLGIVRRCGGTMDVESAVGVGTTFRLFLPYASAVDEEEDFATENTSTARGWSPDKAGAVLLVDDDPVVRMVTSRMMERLGFTVHEAVDGQNAVEVLPEVPEPTLAVVDMTMPGMNGLETVAALRERVPDLPALVVSGYSEDEVPPVENGLFLQKPYTLKQLTRALDQILS
jgi:signal transduction histidine kinase/CheY-like chemotaxis protein